MKLQSQSNPLPYSPKPEPQAIARMAATSTTPDLGWCYGSTSFLRCRTWHSLLRLVVQVLRLGNFWMSTPLHDRRSLSLSGHRKSDETRQHHQQLVVSRDSWLKTGGRAWSRTQEYPEEAFQHLFSCAKCSGETSSSNFPRIADTRKERAESGWRPYGHTARQNGLGPGFMLVTGKLPPGKRLLVLHPHPITRSALRCLAFLVLSRKTVDVATLGAVANAVKCI